MNGVPDTRAARVQNHHLLNRTLNVQSSVVEAEVARFAVVSRMGSESFDLRGIRHHVTEGAHEWSIQRELVIGESSVLLELAT